MSNITNQGHSGTSQQAIAFSDWLRTFEQANAAIGDLARDFILGANDGTNGSLYSTPESFLEMLESEGACHAALMTFEDAADEWSLLTGIPRIPENYN